MTSTVSERRAVFLDVDGVLNSQAWYDAKRARGERLHGAEIDPWAVGCLRRILDATGAQVVLSSTWRGSAELEARLIECGVPLNGHRTPALPSRNRGREIAAWLRRHPEVTEYVILDDDDDAGSVTPARFIKVDGQRGLQDVNVEAAVLLFTAKAALAAVQGRGGAKPETEVAG